MDVYAAKQKLRGAIPGQDPYANRSIAGDISSAVSDAYGITQGQTNPNTTSFNNGANDPAFVADISQAGVNSPVDLQGWYAGIPSGMTAYEYWLQHRNDPAPGSTSGQLGSGGNIYGGIDWAVLDNQAAIAKANQARYDEYMGRAKPWWDTANKFRGMLEDTYSGKRDVMQLPGIQAELATGQQALERSQSAGRRLYGGRAMKEITRFAQDFAAQKRANELAQLNTYSQMGAPFQAPTPQNAAPDVMTLADFQKAYANFGG